MLMLKKNSRGRPSGTLLLKTIPRMNPNKTCHFKDYMKVWLLREGSRRLCCNVNSFFSAKRFVFSKIIYTVACISRDLRLHQKTENVAKQSAWCLWVTLDSMIFASVLIRLICRLTDAVMVYSYLWCCQQWLGEENEQGWRSWRFQLPPASPHKAGME